VCSPLVRLQRRTAEPPEGKGRGAGTIQKLVIGLAVLVVGGLFASNAVRPESRATAGDGSWAGTRHSSSALAAPRSAEVDGVLANVRGGALQLLNQTGAQFAMALHQRVPTAAAATEATVLAMPLSSLLAPEGPMVAALGAPASGPLVLPVGSLKSPSPVLGRGDWFARVRRTETWERDVAELPKSGSKAKPPTLDDALAQARARAGSNPGPVIATFVNLKRFDFGLTWVRRCEKLGLRNFVVGALDPEALALLQALKVPTFQMGATANRAPLPGTHDYGWNSVDFKKMGIEKVQLLADILERNYTVLLMDADAVLVADPLPYFARWVHHTSTNRALSETNPLYTPGPAPLLRSLARSGRSGYH